MELWKHEALLDGQAPEKVGLFLLATDHQAKLSLHFSGPHLAKKKEKKKAEISFYFSMPKEESEHHVCSIGMQIVTSQSFALVVRNN